MLNTDESWRRWGRIDPYYGVLADPRFSRDRIVSNRATFFESGARFVEHVLSLFERHFGALPQGRALDHGCGVGRLTLPLSQRFEFLLGVDVSPDMLAEAARNCESADRPNVEFAGADDELSAAPGPFAFVMSHMVLQHIPVPRGLSILAELLDRVQPGGGFHIHLSTRTESFPQRALYWASANLVGVKLIQNLLAGRPWNSPAMQMNDYPLARVLAALTARGMSDLIILTENHGRFITYGLIGRRPS